MAGARTLGLVEKNHLIVDVWLGVLVEASNERASRVENGGGGPGTVVLLHPDTCPCSLNRGAGDLPQDWVSLGGVVGEFGP